MMPKPKVMILKAAGINCDQETAFAFQSAGAEVEFSHINQVVAGERKLEDVQILAVSGGFTYGDDIAAGKILANELKYKLADALRDFIRSGKLILGVCNGFQVLVKAGILPGNDTPRPTNRALQGADKLWPLGHPAFRAQGTPGFSPGGLHSFQQEATLAANDSGSFEDRWVYLKSQGSKVSKSQVECVWTKGLPEIIYLPVAHGEGKFIPQSEEVLERLRRQGQVVFQYCDERGRAGGYPVNPNGSMDHIAGVCDTTGRVFGLMPHPERHLISLQHPRWTRQGLMKHGDGFLIFLNAVNYFK